MAEGPRDQMYKFLFWYKPICGRRRRRHRHIPKQHQAWSNFNTFYTTAAESYQKHLHFATDINTITAHPPHHWWFVGVVSARHKILTGAGGVGGGRSRRVHSFNMLLMESYIKRDNASEYKQLQNFTVIGLSQWSERSILPQVHAMRVTGASKKMATVVGGVDLITNRPVGSRRNECICIAMVAGK